MSDSETPSPVSTRTRSKKDSASRYGSRRGDDDAGANRSAADGGDATQQLEWLSGTRLPGPTSYCHVHDDHANVIYHRTDRTDRL